MRARTKAAIPVKIRRLIHQLFEVKISGRPVVLQKHGRSPYHKRITFATRYGIAECESGGEAREGEDMRRIFISTNQASCTFNSSYKLESVVIPGSMPDQLNPFSGSHISPN